MKNKKLKINPLKQAIIACLALTTLPVQAATFTVLNANNSGLNSLRAAVILANTTAGADIINFDAGLNGATITLTTGQINISDSAAPLHIDASALANGITISGNNSSRIFGETKGQPLTLTNLTITEGKTAENSSSFTDCSIPFLFTKGGGICAQGNVILTDSHITNNHTIGENASGGGIYAKGGTITNSIISGNTVTNTDAKGGGFFFSAFGSSSDPVTITDSTISSNSAADTIGGGFIVYSTNNVSITGNTISNNISGSMGGFYIFGENNIEIKKNIITQNQATEQQAGGFKAALNSAGTITINKNLISGNISKYGGGGFYTQGNTTITDTIISNNQVIGQNPPLVITKGGGGISIKSDNLIITNSIISNNKTLKDNATGGGIHIGRVNSVTINGCTISGNSTLGDYSLGGGIYIDSRTSGYATPPTVSIVNSTISGNSTSGYAASGGGLHSTILTINNSTITKNTASDTSSYGNGVVVKTTESFTISSTILSGNGNDNFKKIGASSGFNLNNSLFGDSVTEITGTNLNNILTNNPKLAPLSDNGCAVPAGPPGHTSCVQTHQLLATSSALNKGTPNGLTTDQRGAGFARVLSSSADIGAFEGAKSGIPIAVIFGILKTLIIDNP